MSGRRSRNKGAQGERELSKELNRLFGCESHRGRQYHGGPESPDIAKAPPGTHWEVKRTEKLSLYKAMDQATDDAGEQDIPVLAHRRNGKPWLFVCYLNDLPTLAKLLSREPEETE